MKRSHANITICNYTQYAVTLTQHAVTLIQLYTTHSDPNTALHNTQYAIALKCNNIYGVTLAQLYIHVPHHHAVKQHFRVLRV